MFFCANFKTIYTQVKQTGILLLSHLGDKLLLKLAHTVNQDRGITQPMVSEGAHIYVLILSNNYTIY
jgi:hypothetical protein